MAAVVGLATSASADLLYTFDSSASGTDGGGFDGGSYAWSSANGGSVQQSATAGGWTLGSGPKFEFSWPSQSIMQSYLNTYGVSGVMISFDLELINQGSLANNSFLNGTWSDGSWYQLNIAGNSNGNGWTQQAIGGTYNYYASQADQIIHVSEPASWYGFVNPASVPSGEWFQIFFGSNSDSMNAVQFYVDNIAVTVPEPGTLALAGLGAAAMLVFRRR